MRTMFALGSLFALMLIPVGAFAQAQDPPPPAAPAPELEPEPEPSAPPAPPSVPPTHAPPPAPPPPAPPAPAADDEPSAVQSKFDITVYGFVELDAIYDSTQSFNELSGNALIARPGTFAGDHGRTLFTVRNSRLGFKFSAPEFHHIQVIAKMEFDLLGNQPPGLTEIQTFVNDTFRIRHAYLELQTPWVNLLFGQYWQLFGWQAFFNPATVAIQGIPGQLYSRAPQIRIGHTFKTKPFNFEFAAALGRAPQRDTMLPDGQAGLRMSFNKWKGVHSYGSTNTSVDSAVIGISATVRKFALPDPAAMQPSPQTLSTLGWGVSVDALLPIIPASQRRAWAATLHGSFVHGTGIADFYTGLTGGVAMPNTPTLPKGYGPVDIDNGLALLQNDLRLSGVNWQSFLIGLQLYLPPRGKLWLASNFSQMDSDNIKNFLAENATAPGTFTNAVFTQSRWADLNLFWDVTPAVRIAAEYSWFWQLYHDGVEATNHRIQCSAFYIF